MEAPELSVYGEAKSEYTLQLRNFLIPCFEGFFLELLDTAKEQAGNPQKTLWQFQNLLKEIPDWNRDKVQRVTEKIQKESNCDYLDDILTAVFLAHAKVLSAIRLTSKQPKLQLTLPNLDHFLHRCLIECARQLWVNAFLFVETTAIEKQKNLRQVRALLCDSVEQAIRNLLPVKSILREYLHEDKDGVNDDSGSSHKSEEASAEVVETPAEESPAENSAVLSSLGELPIEPIKSLAEVKEEASTTLPELSEVSEVPAAPLVPEAPTVPTIFVDTKPSVSFAQEHVFFDQNNLEANEIQEIPFAEAENRSSEDEDEEIGLTDEIIPVEAEELSL